MQDRGLGGRSGSRRPGQEIAAWRRDPHLGTLSPQRVAAAEAVGPSGVRQCRDVDVARHGRPASGGRCQALWAQTRAVLKLVLM